QFVCGRPWLVQTLKFGPIAFLAGAAVAYLSEHDLVWRVLLFQGVLMAVLAGIPMFNIYTPLRAQIFRWVKWIALAAATWTCFGTSIWSWTGALLIASWGVISVEMTRASIRRKLRVEDWPKHLYL